MQHRFSSISLAERISFALALLVLAVLAVAGCKSKEEKMQEQAIETAKQQAVATGQPQQVTSVDKKGNTIVSVVRPPAQGQTEPVVTTTVTKTTTTTTGDPNAPAANNNASAAAPQPQEPVIQPLDVKIPEGTTLPIRINQTIRVKDAMAGDTFSGTFAEALHDDNGHVLVPRGTPVSGVISAAHKRGHFKGHSYLSLRLTNMTLDGQNYRLSTGRMTETKKGKGKRTAGWIGGASGVGMLIGGIASGGVGLLAGGLAGGGAGTLIAGATGNHDITIPAETVVRFRLTEPLSVVPPQ
ncbi:MAG: hypothetical protein JSS87_10860 [Acidobacteria bacterium]|nr:hypothetical protein [Acidobacteriota bacterium]